MDNLAGYLEGGRHVAPDEGTVVFDAVTGQPVSAVSNTGLDAGGGEELGGVRGILHYMQRTAVQGSPAVLSALTAQ
jgi:oxepin-CoA hydrolase/3-oxo-5,6-dehydrosuberyl-CoA semialdehyde dehydrogenase